MVGLEIRVKIQPEKRVEFLQAVELLIQPVPHARHCVEQTLFEKTGEPNTFLWREDWENDKALDSRQQTQQFRSLLGAVDILGTLIRIRKFTFTKE